MEFAEQRSSKHHVILFPFMAQGHLIPFLALSLEIERLRGFAVTLISTPLNLPNLRASLPPSSAVRLRAIPFNSTAHGLPPATENTDGLPYNLIFRLMEASAELKPAFRDLIADVIREGDEEEEKGFPPPPICIIADMFLGWTAEIAKEFGVYHAILDGSGAFGKAIYYSLWSTIRGWKLEGEEEFEIPDFDEGGKIHVTQLPANMAGANGTDPWSVFLKKRLSEWRESDAILFNTVEELDRVGLGYFRRKLGRPIWAIGPIWLKKGRTNYQTRDQNQCIKWLDQNPPGSVLYICFGSQNTLTESQMKELAMALEASGRNFIWVVRPPLGVDINAEFKAEEWLPEGFEQRIKTQNRGILVRKWAAQAEILGHKSVGGFLSHCGWNSVVEGLSQGVAILGWPMAAEQFFNAKYLEEELGVCVEVGRGNGWRANKEEIMEKIEMVMGESEEAMKVKRRACWVKKMIEEANRDEGDDCKGSSVKAMDEFFNAAILRSEQVNGVPSALGLD